jgi:uncharacterized protein YfaP (DUF2135 family)
MNKDQAIKLAARLSHEATQLGTGFRAEVVEAGSSLPLSVGVETAHFRILFSGGQGTHSLAISVSSEKRILAHWDGYCGTPKPSPKVTAGWDTRKGRLAPKGTGMGCVAPVGKSATTPTTTYDDGKFNRTAIVIAPGTASIDLVTPDGKLLARMNIVAPPSDDSALIVDVVDVEGRYNTKRALCFSQVDRSSCVAPKGARLISVDFRQVPEVPATVGGAS